MMVSNKKKYPEHPLLSENEATLDDLSEYATGDSMNDVFILVYRDHIFDKQIPTTRKKGIK